MVNEQTQKGIIAQLKAELRANELGYIVSKPTTDSCRYDMIIDDGCTLKRIQVKYCAHSAEESEGSVAVNLRKYYLNGKQRPFYSRNEIDAIVVYVAPIDKLCYLPIEVVDGKQTVTLRYEKPKNNQKAKVIECSDYFW